MSRFRVYVRDKVNITTGQMTLLGEIDTYTDFQAINRHNAVGSWSLKMPAGIEQTSLLAPGRGIVVFRDDDQLYPVFSGPIRQIDRSWSKADAGAGAVSVSGVCDNAILRERVGRVTPNEDWPYEAHPDNANVGSPAKSQWPATVVDNPYPTLRSPNNSGEFIHGLLIANFTTNIFNGDVDQSRAITHLDLDVVPSASLRALPNDDLWKGFPVNMSNLETTVFAVAEAAGLAVRFQWQKKSKTDPADTDANKLYVNITPISDKSNSVVFDPKAGNLSSYTLSSVAPDNTRAIVGTQVADGGRRWFGIKKNDFFDPAGWVDRENRDAFGNRVIPTSDGTLGRQKIEVDWNTSAEMFVDSRDILWEFQVRADNDRQSSLSPPTGSDAAIQINQVSTKALVENGPKGLLTMTAVDTPACTFGVDYFVSDVVRVLLDNSFLPESMRPEDGILRETVREVKLSSTASAIWVIEPSVGTSDTSPTPYIYKQLKKLRSVVEDTANRNESNPLATSLPAAPGCNVNDLGSFYATAPFPPSTGYCFTERPTVGQKYRVLLSPLVNRGDPDFVEHTTAEVMMDLRNGENGDWIRQSDIIEYPGNDAKFWWKDLTMTGTVGDVQYVRVRFSRAGAVSDWSRPVLKLTAAAGAINTGGTLTLNTPPGVHHPNALFNLTGTDTTRGQLTLQIENPVGSGYVSGYTAPSFSGTNGNNFSIEHKVPDVTGTYNVRVVSSEQMGIGHNLGTIYKTSSVVTINVV